MDSAKPSTDDREGSDALIKCNIEIEVDEKGDLVIVASMPEAEDAHDLEHVAAEALKQKIDEWIKLMAPLGDLTSMEGTGAGAEAIKKILGRDGANDGR